MKVVKKQRGQFCFGGKSTLDYKRNGYLDRGAVVSTNQGPWSLGISHVEIWPTEPEEPWPTGIRHVVSWLQPWGAVEMAMTGRRT